MLGMGVLLHGWLGALDATVLSVAAASTRYMEVVCIVLLSLNFPYFNPIHRAFYVFLSLPYMAVSLV